MLKKKILLWMLVLLSCTACITQAESYVVNIWENMYNTTYWNYTYTYNIDSNLNFKTDDTYNTFFYTYDWWWYNGIRSRMLFWNDNKLYTYWAFQQDMIYWQGYISWFCMSNTTDYETYCNKFNRTNYNTNIDTFYELWAIYDQVYFNADTYTPILCFISNTQDIVSCIHQEISYQRNLQNTITPWNLISTIWIKPEQFVNEESKRQSSPFIAPWPWTEWTPIACRSINDMIRAYGKVYNTWMCYTPWITISWWQIVTTEQKSIFQIFSWFNEYQQLRTLYYNNCHTPYTQEHCMNAMSWQEDAINFFNYIERTNENSNYNVIAERLYQYCWLNLQFTDEEKETEWTCTLNNDNLYAPWITEETWNPSLIDSISNILDDELWIGIVTPQTWTVFDEFLEDGETRLEWISINRIKTFKDAYTKVMWLFKYRQTQQWIIPWYIVSLITIIVLLALFKK